jgi:two-component system, OmpR family, sensor kinase
MKRKLGVRRRLLLAMIGSVALSLVAITVVFNVVLGQVLDSEVNKRLESLASDEKTIVQVAGDQVTVPRTGETIQGLGSQVWVFSGETAVIAPSVGPDIRTAVARLAEGDVPFAEVPGYEVKLYNLPLFSDTGKRVGAIVAALSLAPYNQTKSTALIGSLGFAAALLLMVGFGGRWLLRAALRPVLTMTAEAEAWSSHDLDRRFAVGEPYDEFTHLAATLDSLLNRLAAGLRRERQFSAEVSHQLRTPLAQIRGEAELALRRERDPGYYQEALASVLQGADQMTRTIETLLAASQGEGSLAHGRGDVWAILADVVRSMGILAEENGVEVMVQPPPLGLFVGVDADVAVQILQPVAENACRFARSRVLLGAVRRDAEVVFVVEDDGPGVADEEQDRIFEPGVQGSAAAENEAAPSRANAGRRGVGLGLSLARRLARAASGDVVVSHGDRGARFVIRLPAG